MLRACAHSFDELLSLGLWSSDDVYRQQGASLLLGELLMSSFTLLVFLPPPYIHAATTGALRLLADPRWDPLEALVTSMT